MAGPLASIVSAQARSNQSRVRETRKPGFQSSPVGRSSDRSLLLSGGRRRGNQATRRPASRIELLPRTAPGLLPRAPSVALSLTDPMIDGAVASNSRVSSSGERPPRTSSTSGDGTQECKVISSSHRGLFELKCSGVHETGSTSLLGEHLAGRGKRYCARRTSIHNLPSTVAKPPVQDARDTNPIHNLGELVAGTPVLGVSLPSETTSIETHERLAAIPWRSATR